MVNESNSDGGIKLLSNVRNKPSHSRFFIAGFLLLILILFSQSIAYAHASVVKSNPTAGAALQTSPHTVQIWFDEAVQNSFYGIDVTNAQGKRVDIGDGHLAPNNHALLECTLKDNLKDGYYLTHWHAVSDDGHHVSGTIPFTIGTVGDDLIVPAVSQANQTLPPILVVVNRWIQYLGFILLCGLLIFASFILDKRIRSMNRTKVYIQKITWILLVLLGLSVFTSLPIQASIDTGKPISEIWHLPLFRTVLATGFGYVFVWQAGITAALFLTAIIMQLTKLQTRYVWYIPMAVLSFCMLVSKSLIGHAVSSSHPIYSVTADVFHLTAASIWLGSLVGMVWLLPIRESKESWHLESYWITIRRFSIWGIITVLVLVASGLYATFINIPDMYTLFHTKYGQSLDLKLVLFIIMLVFALFHLIKGQKRDQTKTLTRTIRTELGFGIAILLVTAFLTNLPTAKLSPGPYENTQSLPDGSSITLHVTPNVAGVNEIDVILKNSEGKAEPEVDKASIALTSLDHYAGTNNYSLKIDQSGQSKLIGLYLSTAGRWYVTVHVLINKTEDKYAHFQFEVGSPS